MRHDIRHWGFRSFKFRDPLFGLNRNEVFRLAELIGRLPQKIQFSIETRIDLMRPEVLRVLKRVGLTSITVGIETPDDETPCDATTARRSRKTGSAEFIGRLPRLGIRTVAGFMIGFPEDTEQSIRRVLGYAKAREPDVRQLQHRHALSGHRVLRADQGRRSPISTSATTRSTRRC